jgi:hypothetical protein
VIVVALIAAFGVWALTRGGPPSDADLVKRWFRSPAGGSTPRAVTDRLRVGTCALMPDAHAGRPVFECPTRIGGSRRLRTCFVLTDDAVVFGPSQLADIPGCDPLRYDRPTNAFVDPRTGKRLAPA